MKWIDISHNLDETTPVYPGNYETTLSKIKSIEKDYYTAYLLKSGLHTGTHIDMPMHLIEDDKTAMDFSIDHFVGKGVLLDVRGEKSIVMKAQYEEMINEQDIVLLFTGYDAHYFKEEYFSDHPVVSDELAGFLLEKKIKILGMDMPAPDFPPFTFHKALLNNGIFVLENLVNLGSLVDVDQFEVMAFPLKIKAEASFVRAVCKIGY